MFENIVNFDEWIAKLEQEDNNKEKLEFIEEMLTKFQKELLASKAEHFSYLFMKNITKYLDKIEEEKLFNFLYTTNFENFLKNAISYNPNIIKDFFRKLQEIKENNYEKFHFLFNKFLDVLHNIYSFNKGLIQNHIPYISQRILEDINDSHIQIKNLISFYPYNNKNEEFKFIKNLDNIIKNNINLTIDDKKHFAKQILKAGAYPRKKYDNSFDINNDERLNILSNWLNFSISKEELEKILYQIIKKISEHKTLEKINLNDILKSPSLSNEFKLIIMNLKEDTMKDLIENIKEFIDKEENKKRTEPTMDLSNFSLSR